jgi:hypothetical protein|tara:strand:- start:600 stop:824 length:225 start_codon:yes stop_codon:yes gene_type:complete
MRTSYNKRCYIGPGKFFKNSNIPYTIKIITNKKYNNMRIRINTSGAIEPPPSIMAKVAPDLCGVGAGDWADMVV